MNPLQHIELHKDEFTKSELIIMDYVLNNLKEISTNAISSTAEKCNVSKSALLRFCQKCGYKGYSEFKYEISRYLLSTVNLELGDSDNKAETFVKMYSEQINNIPNTVTSQLMMKLSEIIISARKIKIFGVHETGLAATYFTYRLANLGVDSEAITYPSLFVEKAYMGNKDDLHIFLSLSAETPVIKETIEYSYENNCYIVLITQNDLHKFVDKVDLTILFPTFKYQHQNIFLDSQSLLFVTIDLLINNLASKLIEESLFNDQLPTSFI